MYVAVWLSMPVCLSVCVPELLATARAQVVHTTPASAGTFFRPEDAHLLYPEYTGSLDPTFAVSLDDPVRMWISARCWDECT